MPVDDLKVVDIVSIDLDGNVVLTISDHLEWDLKNEHILILQKKLNAYLSFIESGELYESYSNAKDRKIIIQLAIKYLPDETGRKFIQLVKEFLLGEGYNFICNTDLVKV